MAFRTRKTSSSWMAAMAGALFASGCMTDRISLSADKDSAPADGMTVIELVARGSSFDGPLPDGAQITFTASEPLLFPVRDPLREAAEAGLRPLGGLELVAPVRQGAATAYLLAPAEEKIIDVQAGFSAQTDTGTENYSTGVSVTFTAAPLVSAGDKVGAGPAAMTANFLFECAVDNIGGFVKGRPDLVVPCEITLRDQSGRELPHTPVKFFSEAGEIVDLEATGESFRGIFYKVPAVLDGLPTDVAPLPWEMDYTRSGSGLIPGAAQQNPRDGLVTLLAVVRGQEAFTDVNGDGVRNQGEPFFDEGEPFLDANDNGVFDPAVDEQCCDNNGNGQVDGPNGKWDSDVWIGRTHHILWTGPVAEGPGRSGYTPEPPSFVTRRASVSLSVVDANGNPVAMLGGQDGFAVTVGGPVDLFPAPDLGLKAGSGLTVRDRYPLYFFGDGRPVVEGLEVEGVRKWDIKLRDLRAPEENNCLNGDWSLDTSVQHTPGFGSEGGMPSFFKLLTLDGNLCYD